LCELKSRKSIGSHDRFNVIKAERREYMKFTEKSVIIDADESKRIISRMAYEILERNRGAKDVIIIGIQTRGVLLAKAIRKKIMELEGVKIPMGTLDITFYRDDLTRLNAHPIVKDTDIPFSIEDKRIVLVDDVLYSGRTIRAAIDELFDMGRPEKVELAVLVDRGQREVPISADYIGKSAPTAKNEYISVEISETGEISKVSICSK
jgi:pyrimidine operon attenuation protein/uracil phosphoribosyltransferase